MKLTDAQRVAVETLLAGEWRAGHERTLALEPHLLHLRTALGLPLPKDAARLLGEIGVPLDIGREPTPAESRAWEEGNAEAQLDALFAARKRQFLDANGKLPYAVAEDLDVVYGDGDRTLMARAAALRRLQARAARKGRGK
jgi:hypothetical protein